MTGNGGGGSRPKRWTVYRMGGREQNNYGAEVNLVLRLLGTESPMPLTADQASGGADHVCTGARRTVDMVLRFKSGCV